MRSCGRGAELGETRVNVVALTIAEAAAMAGRSQSWVRARRRSGPLEPMEVNGRHAVSLASLAQFLGERRAASQEREKIRMLADLEQATRLYMDTCREVARLRGAGADAGKLSEALEELGTIAAHTASPRLKQRCARTIETTLDSMSVARSDR